MKKTLLLALVLQASTTALAIDTPVNPDHRWFQADVIVFRHLNNTSDEVWPQVTQHSMAANAIALKASSVSLPEPLSGNLLEPVQGKAPLAPDLARVPFIRLPSGDYKLGKQATSLNRSSRYQILSQTAWRMPVDDSLREIPVKIKASGNKNGQFLLEGTITVSSSRFLHVDADFWYSELAPEALSNKLTATDANRDISDISKSGQRKGSLLHSESLESPVKITRNFHLNQRRRIRNTSEIQYLDSPVIGVLIKLTPYERPQTILEVEEPNVTKR